MPDFDAVFLKNLLFAFGAVIWTISGILGVVVAVKLLMRKKTVLPQPFETKRAVTFATREDHDALARKVDRNHEATERRFDVMHAASSASREKIYNRLNAIGEEVASQRKADELTQATLARMDNKLDKLNERKADK